MSTDTDFSTDIDTGPGEGEVSAYEQQVEVTIAP